MCVCCVFFIPARRAQQHSREGRTQGGPTSAAAAPLPAFPAPLFLFHSMTPYVWMPWTPFFLPPFLVPSGPFLFSRGVCLGESLDIVFGKS